MSINYSFVQQQEVKDFHSSDGLVGKIGKLSDVGREKCFDIFAHKIF